MVQWYYHINLRWMVNNYWEGFVLALNDQVYDQIVKLCSEGNAFVEKGKDNKAIASCSLVFGRCRTSSTGSIRPSLSSLPGTTTSGSATSGTFVPSY